MTIYSNEYIPLSVAVQLAVHEIYLESMEIFIVIQLVILTIFIDFVGKCSLGLSKDFVMIHI